MKRKLALGLGVLQVSKFAVITLQLIWSRWTTAWGSLNNNWETYL